MEPSQTQRRKHVAELRRLARHSDLAPTARDDVGRAKVMAMVAALKSANPDGEVAQQLLGLGQAYVQTFRDAAAQMRPAKPAPFRVRGTSFLLTWNWSFVSRQLRDGTMDPSTEAKLWTCSLLGRS